MSNSEKTSLLNDQFRTSMQGGRLLMTSGIQALPGSAKEEIIQKVMGFDDFNEDNDPYGEHDFGSLFHQGNKVFWKIDYYANDLVHGSEDPANPEITTRVMTIMLANEY